MSYNELCNHCNLLEPKPKYQLRASLYNLQLDPGQHTLLFSLKDMDQSQVKEVEHFFLADTHQGGSREGLRT